MRRAAVIALCFGSLACGGADGDETGSESGSAPPPGESAQGWLFHWTEGAVRFDCDADESSLLQAGVPNVKIEDTAIYVGFEQIGDNQNPLLARFDAGQQVYCRRHETEGPDGRAEGLTWNGGDQLYIVYTIVGGGSALEGKGGWLDAYAPGAISGGGPKVSVVGLASAASGELESASFVIAVKSDGKVNSHSPRAAPKVLDSGEVEFLGGSAHKPIDPNGTTSMDCTDYPFDSRYVFSADLSTLSCASCSNCVSSVECE